MDLQTGHVEDRPCANFLLLLFTMKFFSMTASLAIEATEAVKYGKSE